MKWNRESKLNGLLVLSAAVGIWELVSRLELINPLFFPPMSKILNTFFHLISSGEILHQILMSLKRAAAGYFLAAMVFIPLGLAMGMFQWLYRSLEIIIETLRPIPPPVVVPVAMLFFGLGDEMKVFVIFFSCAWPILLNTFDGVRNIDRVLLYTARTFGLSHGRSIAKVVLPAASPQIMTGLRISLSITLILVVISEMVGSSDGIGYFILDSQRRLKVTQMYAGMLTLAVLGYALNQIFYLFHKRALAWHYGLTKRSG
jgi:ABC-type nitrate/sulfonate/bicarbonate transport system permease component